MTKKERDKQVAELAVGSPQDPILIGNFESVLRGAALNIYYNIDLGQHKENMFDVDNGEYQNLHKLHFSLHDSGQGHLKSTHGAEKFAIGNLSDGNKLINCNEDLTIFGLESFYLDRAPSPTKSISDLKILTPPGQPSSFSILWLFAHSSYPSVLPNRMMWVNLWGYEKQFYRVQTASLSDILITHKIETVLNINDWSIRACFIKTLLPIFNRSNNDITLIHPKGLELPWRAFTFIDVHLPLSEIIEEKAKTKPRILTSDKPNVEEASCHPSAWIKFK